MESDTKANWLAALIFGTIAAILGFVFVHLSIGNSTKFASYDLLFALRPLIKPTEAVIIYMDEEAHTALGQSLTEAWDRNLHARLVDHLTASGAKAVVFDIHFSGIGRDPQATKNLERAIQQNGRVVLGADVIHPPSGQRGFATKRILPPFDPLADAAAGIGSDELESDADVTVRRHLRASPDDFVPSLSWAAASVAKAAPQQQSAERWINYYGPPGAIPHLSYHRALEAPLEVFKDKVVFVGARLMTKFAGERKDEYRTPYRRPDEPFVSGVGIQATAFLNLVRGDWLRRLSPMSEGIIVILIGFGSGLALTRLRPWIAATVAVALAAALSGISYVAFTSQLTWFPWLIPVAIQVPLALALAVIYNSFRIYLDNKLLEQSLARHLSPARAKQLLRQRGLLQPGAEKQLLSIMFTDIADFTKISEGMDSGAMAKLMNNYFEEAISCVYQTDGFLVKLIGDALFAIWNAPITQPDHQDRVFRAALLLRERVTNFKGPDGIVLRTRIGIHAGVADVGNFGSAKRFDYTAIGENINLASRLEGLNKYLGTHILASADAVAPVREKFHFHGVGRFRLKGFEKAVEVHELVAEPAQWHKLFAEALAHLSQRQFDAAEDTFCRVMKSIPEDGPTRFYLERIRELRAKPPSDRWAGEIEVSEK